MEECPRIPHVLYHDVSCHQIERVIGKGQLLNVAAQLVAKKMILPQASKIAINSDGEAAAIKDVGLHSCGIWHPVRKNLMTTAKIEPARIWRQSRKKQIAISVL